jgi:hypothetical protein
VGAAQCIGVQNSRFFSPLGLSLGRVGGIGVATRALRLVDSQKARRCSNPRQTFRPVCHCVWNLNTSLFREEGERKLGDKRKGGGHFGGQIVKEAKVSRRRGQVAPGAGYQEAGMGAMCDDEPATQRPDASSGDEQPRLVEEPDPTFLEDIAWHCQTFAQGFQFAMTWHSLFMIFVTCLCTFLCSKGILDFSFDISMGIVAVGTVLPLVFSVQVVRPTPSSLPLPKKSSLLLPCEPPSSSSWCSPWWAPLLILLLA